jgi:hypothetical protein
MKKMNLNNYGVQEMNAEEMRVVEGGTLGEWLAGVWNWLVGHSTGSGIAIDI